METLFTPWRYAYISGQEGRAEGCFLCAAAATPDDPERLVVHRTAAHQVVLNRHPYNNGHVMIAPLAHVAVPEAESAEATAEVWPLVLCCRAVLESVYRPGGMNIGLNLGGPAGAGVPDHFHVHLVPRWQGDTNFMTALGGTRLIPEDLHATWQRLRDRFQELEG